MVLQPRPQVHSEDGSEASTEGESEHAHLDVQAHPDDPVPGLVELRVDELLCLVDLGQHRLIRKCNFLKQVDRTCVFKYIAFGAHYLHIRYVPGKKLWKGLGEIYTAGKNSRRH